VARLCRACCVFLLALWSLAEEKVEDFRCLAEAIKAAGGPEVRLRVSTGDYQLTKEFVDAPPPDDGEILVCTPERLEIILRNPEHHAWAEQIWTCVIDEFHLLGG